MCFCPSERSELLKPFVRSRCIVLEILMQSYALTRMLLVKCPIQTKSSIPVSMTVLLKASPSRIEVPPDRNQIRNARSTHEIFWRSL